MNGYELKWQRELKDLTREELADSIGVEEEDIHNWEEYSYNPPEHVLESLANALGMGKCEMIKKLDIDDEITYNMEDISLGGALLAIGALIVGTKILSKIKENKESKHDKKYYYVNGKQR